MRLIIRDVEAASSSLATPMVRDVEAASSSLATPMDGNSCVSRDSFFCCSFQYSLYIPSLP